MNGDNVDELLQDFFIILSKIIVLNDALENIRQQLIVAWNAGSR